MENFKIIDFFKLNGIKLITISATISMSISLSIGYSLFRPYKIPIQQGQKFSPKNNSTIKA